MKLNFQQEALVLPGGVLSCCDAASDVQLRALLWLASDLTLAQKPKQLAKLAGCDAKTLQAALEFWVGQGVLLPEASVASVPAMAEVAEVVEEAPAAPTAPAQKHLQRANEFPNYTSTELAGILESRAGVRSLVDEAQRLLGRIFNLSEVNILVGMLDYLGMSEEGVLMLLAHCKRIEKTRLRSIEKYAIDLADRGITEPAALEEEFRALEAFHSFEGQVRSMFGMKSRALTGRESKILRAWLSFGYDIDVVRLAYEKTVNATNEPSVFYANAILERWHSEGWKTLEEIEAALAAEDAKREAPAGEKGQSILGNSFDTDDFFEAALQRSFRERRDE